MSKNIKKIISFSIVSFLVFQILYLVVEPQKVIAATATDDVIVTLVVGSGITISAPGDVTMSPAISMVTNGSLGTVVWNVQTNNVTGYKLAVKASESPALVSGVNSFADYTEASSGVPDAWSVANGDKEFGFSAFGTNTNTTTWGTGANCGTGSTPTATLKYIGFETSDRDVATQNTSTSIAGINTTVCFAAAQNNVFAPSGTYTAIITATATEL